MILDEIIYVCNVMGDLSGIPIRIYKNKELVHYHSIIYLPKDPINLCLDELFNVRENIGYYITEDFDYYGIVNSNDTSVIYGPTRLLKADSQHYKKQAFDLDINKDEINEFVNGMNSIVNMPLESIMQMLCVLNYFLNGEKKTIKELSIVDFSTQKFQNEINSNTVNETFSNIDEPINKETHNTINIENQIMNIITKGDIDTLESWTKNAPAIRSGQLATNDIRHLKNTFIVTTSLAARAAIRGGMSVEDSLALSDAYIQKCEMQQTHNSVTNLQYAMIYDYTEKVSKIQKASINSKLALEVINYTKRHLSEPINTQKIADNLFISRSGLSTKFKKETGKNLTEFIMEYKIEEAKDLLKYTSNSILMISEYLGFSSQSHFNRTFLKAKGMTPVEYRKKHNK